MTATEILRRMLDERGVGWRGGLPTETIVTDPIDVLYVQRTDGMIHVYIRSYLTPEQAIAATLGSCNCSSNCTNGERTETCEADETDLIPFVRADSDDFEVDYIHVMECTECGHTYEHVNGDYEFCPRCGRKRKDVDE